MASQILKCERSLNSLTAEHDNITVCVVTWPLPGPGRSCRPSCTWRPPASPPRPRCGPRRRRGRCYPGTPPARADTGTGNQRPARGCRSAHTIITTAQLWWRLTYKMYRRYFTEYNIGMLFVDEKILKTSVQISEWETMFESTTDCSVWGFPRILRKCPQNVVDTYIVQLTNAFPYGMKLTVKMLAMVCQAG